MHYVRSCLKKPKGTEGAEGWEGERESDSQTETELHKALGREDQVAISYYATHHEALAPFPNPLSFLLLFKYLLRLLPLSVFNKKS